VENSSLVQMERRYQIPDKAVHQYKYRPSTFPIRLSNVDVMSKSAYINNNNNNNKLLYYGVTLAVLFVYPVTTKDTCIFIIIKITIIIIITPRHLNHKYNSVT